MWGPAGLGSARIGSTGLGSDEVGIAGRKSAQKISITVHTSWKKSSAPGTIRSLPNVPLPNYTVGLNPHYFRQSKCIFPMPKKTLGKVIIALSYWGFACYKKILSWSILIFDRELRDDEK